jgi:hypothetical protein
VAAPSFVVRGTGAVVFRNGPVVALEDAKATILALIAVLGTDDFILGGSGLFRKSRLCGGLRGLVLLWLVVTDVSKGVEWTDALVGLDGLSIQDLGGGDADSPVETFLALDGTDTGTGGCGVGLLGRLVVADVSVGRNGAVAIVGLLCNSVYDLVGFSTGSAVETLLAVGVTDTQALWLEDCVAPETEGVVWTVAKVIFLIGEGLTDAAVLAGVVFVGTDDYQTRAGHGCDDVVVVVRIRIRIRMSIDGISKMPMGIQSIVGSIQYDSNCFVLLTD